MTCDLIEPCAFFSEPNWVAAVGTWAGAIAAFAAVFFAAGAIREQTRNSRLEKVADALFECNSRYDSVRAARDGAGGSATFSGTWSSRVEPDARIVRRGDINLTRVEAEPAAANLYYKLFWSVQFDQWEYYRLGLIPREIFWGWWRARLKDFYGNGHDKVGSKSFLEGWADIARGQFEYFPMFRDFVDQVVSVGKANWGDQKHQRDPSKASPAKKNISECDDLAEVLRFNDEQAKAFRSSIRKQLS